MGEPEQRDSGGPGVHGFAKSFAATLRQPGEQDKPNIVSRMAVICLTVAVIVGGAVGVGMLLSYQRQQNNKKQSASTVALHTNASPSSTGATSVKPGGTERSSNPSPLQNAAGSVPAGSQHKTTSQTGSGSTTPGSGPSGSTTSKSTSTATPLPTRSIMSYASSRCIDVTNGSTAPGTQLQIWDCRGANWQQWSFPSDGTVRSMGMCMAVAAGSTADGAAIQLAKCNGSSAQKFTLNSSNDLVNLNADKCVDVKDQQTANGTPLQLWSCGGTSNQKWHLG